MLTTRRCVDWSKLDIRCGFFCLVICAAPGCARAETKLAPGLETDLPMALTPTRLRQPINEVPASITIITADMLHDFGIRSITDALRLVPGMAVTEVTGTDARVNYHGTNILVPRRMNVRLDGMAVYQPGFAMVDWNILPVAMDDIDRIEVVRGPDLAAYGGNSMLATINIVTKHPDDQAGSMLRISSGTQRTREIVARHGGRWNETTTYRVTLAHRSSSGYDTSLSKVPAHNDGISVKQLDLRANTVINAYEQLDWSALVVQSINKKTFVDRFQASVPDVTTQDFYVNAIWTKQFDDRHELKMQAYASQNEKTQTWTTCVPRATLLPELFAMWRSNPSYANALLAGRMPSGGTAQDNALAISARNALIALGPAARQRLCVTPNQNIRERRFDWELQNTYVFSPDLRMVGGVGVRAENAASPTFLGGSVSNTIERLFGNIEYKPESHTVINLGIYSEFDRMSGNSVSPRIGLNYHLTPQDTIRFMLSSGGRAADMKEQRANWTYQVPQGRFYQSAAGNGNIKRERIVSREIGYIGNYHHYGMQLDAKLFDDSLTQLVSEKLQLSDFRPTNSNWARLRGAEFQLRYKPNDSWMAFANYAYLHNEASTILEQTQYARHSGALGVTHSFNPGWRVSLAAYAHGADSPSQSPYGRQDLTLSKSIALKHSQRVTASMVIRHLQQRTVRYFENFCCTRSSSYDNAMQYLTTLEFHF